MPAVSLHSRSVLWAHLKLGAAVAVGAAGVLLTPLIPCLADHRWLAGWDLGAVTYLALLWRTLLAADESDIRARAPLLDESVGVLLSLVVALIAASVGGIVATLLAAKSYGPQEKLVVAGLTAATLALGWLVLQSLFAAHYAHRHFVEAARNPDAGFGFPGEPPTSYLDFLYLSFSVGATFQVSDNTVGSTRLRNLVTAHAAAAYLYNTAILAVGISLLASFVTQ